MSVAIRTCVGCSGRDEQSRMLRLRLAGDGRISLRARRAGHGRSAYVHLSPVCVRSLAKSKALVRSLRHGVDGAARAELITFLESALVECDGRSADECGN